jgi:hypothetical protein
MLFKTRKETHNALQELKDSLPLQRGDLLMVHSISMKDPHWIEIEYTLFQKITSSQINERLMSL